MLSAFIVGNSFALLTLFSIPGSWVTQEDQAQIDEYFSSFGAAFYTSINMMYMTVDPTLMKLSFAPQLAAANYVYFSVMVALIMLNLLIAIMSGSYERVQEGATNAGLQERAEMLVSWELLMSDAEIADETVFPRWFCLYKQKNQEETHEARGLVNRVNRKFEEDFRDLSNKVEALDAKLTAQNRLLEELVSR